ncbi:MAG: M28 family peptidase, partial [Thermomicrobiales bacterium]
MMAPATTEWRGGEAETAFLGTLSAAMPWELIHEFSQYVRESGTQGEQKAVDAITRRLTEWGIPHTVHHPRCFISLPRGATVAVTLTDGASRTLRGTTPAFAVPTGDAGVTGQAVAVEAAHASSVSTIFTSGLGNALEGQDVAGKIAILNGLPMPARIGDLTHADVAAAIFISPGNNVHEGICTPTWGTPDLDTVGAMPTLSVVEVNKPDGTWLMEQARGGMVREVTMQAHLETRWREIPVTVAEIQGAVVPEEFVLVHGHLDSWGEGIGDNATGDAALLELAR